MDVVTVHNHTFNQFHCVLASACPFYPYQKVPGVSEFGTSMGYWGKIIHYLSLN